VATDPLSSVCVSTAVPVGVSMGRPVVVVDEKSLIMVPVATVKTFVSSLQHVLPSEEQQYLSPPHEMSSSYEAV
jgi:hypothetical protein